jgi:anti-sigma B factor antagonist
MSEPRYNLEYGQINMSLEIVQKEREGITVLELNGRITMGEEATKFRQIIQTVAQAANPKLILDMQRVDYIDSTGLGAVVMSSTALGKAGGVVKLLNLNRRNIELLVATKLTTIFEIFSDEQDAVNSFFPGREIKRFDILEFVKTQK